MEKLRKLIQMTEHPEQYCDEEWQEIFDGETVSKAQVEEAWTRFERRHMGTPRQQWMKIAASFVGVLMLSGIALAAIHIIRSSHNDVEADCQSPTQEVQVVNTNQLTEQATNTPARTVVFEDAELRQIVDSLSLYYKVKPAYRHEAVRHLRLYYEWDQHQSLGRVVSELNHFDHVSIGLQGDSIIIK